VKEPVTRPATLATGAIPSPAIMCHQHWPHTTWLTVQQAWACRLPPVTYPQRVRTLSCALHSNPPPLVTPQMGERNPTFDFCGGNEFNSHPL